MLHAIDGRTGVEVWAYIPFNLLPKLSRLRRGQPVGSFNFYVDGSPKVADVVVKRHARVRRAKLYYLRDRIGKATRLTERRAKRGEAETN